MSATILDPASPSPQIKVQYTGGQCVFHTNGGETLGADNFSDFCTSYLQTPIEVRITRAKYQALPKKGTSVGGIPQTVGQADWKKRIPFFTSGFAPHPPNRKKETMRQCSLVSIDIDNSDEARKLLEGDYIADSLPWNYFAYRTISSTPGKPRLRIVVDAETFPMENYAEAVHHVCDLLGVQPNDETMDCSRPMFRPSVFQLPGTAPASFESPPTLSFRVDGLPMPMVGPVVPERPDNGGANLADMTGMAAPGIPVPGVGREEVNQMLKHISPNVSREDWIKVLCGIKHQFADDEIEGFDIFHDWSSQNSMGAYVSEEEDQKTWDSFKAIPGDHRKPRTIATVVHMAKLGGWDGKLTGNAVERLKQTIRDSTSTSALTNAILKEIALEKGLDDPDRASLILDVKARLRALSYNIGLPDLRRRATDFRQEAARAAEAAAPMPEWLAGWVYVTNVHRMYRVKAPTEAIKLEAFDVECSLPCRREAGDEDLELKPSHVMTNHPAFPKAARQDYNPSRPGEVTYMEDGLLVMNIYRDTSPEMDEERSEEAGKILMDHLARNFPDPINQALLLSSLAFMVQQPGRKSRWSPFIQGAHGSGKTFLAGMMRAVLGWSNVMLVNSGMLHSDFNDWAFGTQLLVFDEIMTGSDKKGLMDKLKPYTSEDWLSINRKGLPATNARNRASCLFISNYDEGIRIDDSERRYFVLKSVLQTKEHVAALPKGYFDQLFALAGPLAGAVRHFLAHYTLHPGFDPDGPAPLTEDREKIVANSLNEIDVSIKELIHEGNSPLVQSDLISSTVLIQMIKGRSGPWATDKGVCKALVRLGFTPLKNAVHLPDRRHSLWVHETFADVLDRTPGEVVRDRYVAAESAGFHGE